MKRISRVIMPVFTAFMLVACGGSSAEKSAKSDKSESASPKKEEVAEKAVVEKEKEVIEITLIAKGEDMTAISYDPKSLTIPAGTRVKLTLKNESVAAGMLHNFVLVNLGTGQEVATAGIKAGEKSNFVPKDPNVLASTEILQMGTSTTIEFDAPAKGSYHYICTYPGHYPNMIGRLNVE